MRSKEKMRKLIGFLVCGLVGALLLAGPASAQIGSLDKCAAALEKEQGKLEKDMFLRLNKCVDRIIKEREKGAKGCWMKAADFCEKMLGKTVDVSQGVLSETGKDKLSKFFAGVTKASTTKCDSSGAAGRQDLDDLGHMAGTGAVPFVNAPGGLDDFAKNWLAALALQHAWQRQVQVNGLTRTRLRELLNKPGDCGLPEVDSNDSESIVVLAASTIVAPIRGTNVFDICNLGDVAVGGASANPRLDLQGARLIAGSAGATTVLDAILSPAQTVCIRTYRVSGWCDCVGTGLPAKDTFFCQDHVVDPDDPNPVGPTDSDACDLGGGISGRPVKGIEEECVCAPAAEIGCKDLNDCDPVKPFVKCDGDYDCAGTDICVATEGKARCHAGTYNGEQVTQLGGAMGVGDCLVFTTTTLSTMDPGSSEVGNDGIPCTRRGGRGRGCPHSAHHGLGLGTPRGRHCPLVGGAVRRRTHRGCLPGELEL
jgi:hypothetical protein